MREYTNLKKLREVSSNHVYCPSCRNDVEVVLNGFFHGELFYCPKEKKIFCIYLRDITKRAGEAYLKSCEEDVELEEIRRKITKKNYKEVKELVLLK
jgi:hypothetical protein